MPSFGETASLVCAQPGCGPLVHPNRRVAQPTMMPRRVARLVCLSSQREAITNFYTAAMPSGLERCHGGHDLHFITFSCYHRQPLLGSARWRDLFLRVLEQVRQRYQWVVMGYVVMPEHVHLLVNEPQQGRLATAMQALKLGFARRVLAEQRRRECRAAPELFEHRLQRVWQARYFDFNVCSTHKRAEKLRYIHRNPVKRGLVEAPEFWRWSSFRTYAYQERGAVGVNQWSAIELKRRERSSFAR